MCEHFLKLIYYPLKLSQINKRLFRNGCPTNVRLCLNQLHFQFVQTSMIYKRPWLLMPLDIIQQWQRLQYSDWTRKAWVPWMRKFGLTAYQLSYKELHKLPFRPKRQLFYFKKKMSKDVVSNMIDYNLHKIGNFPTLSIKRPITAKPDAYKISKMSPCSKVSSSSFVTQTFRKFEFCFNF